MLQAFLVVPAFALAYLIAAPTPLPRRIRQLLAAGGALAVSSLWWVVAVQLVPAADRPYIGGSQNNSLWNLIFGYNGFGRLTGNETGSVGGGTGGSRWGATGLLRMFNAEFGGQASWLIPAALILLVAALVFTVRAPRTDRTRAALVLWGGWLAVTGAVFSLGQGIIHPYYTVALTPAVGALVGIGSVTLWARRNHGLARAVLAAAVGATAVWAYVLLVRTPVWHPWLRNTELIIGLAVAVLLVAWTHRRGRITTLVAVAAIVVALAGPTAYTMATVATPHSGGIPAAGPAGASGRLGRGFRGARPGRAGAFAGGAAGAGGLRALGGPPAQPGGFGPGPGAGTGTGRGPGGPGGLGLLNRSTPSAALTTALEQGSGSYTWIAATVGSNEASGYQLATSRAVLAIGGFNGTDPAPTLSQFETYVQQGKIHFFIATNGAGGRDEPRQGRPLRWRSRSARNTLNALRSSRVAPSG
jgi:4-amino-4-deoxy-L-arabinose transferase-like glycosyltransferase